VFWPGSSAPERLRLTLTSSMASDMTVKQAFGVAIFSVTCALGLGRVLAEDKTDCAITRW